MDPQIAVDIGRHAVHTVLVLAAPVLVVAALVGVLTGLLQAVTQINDQTILFVARMIAVVVVLSVCMPWLVEHYTSYSREIFQQIPHIIAGQPAR